jgi:hypothetical protein
MGATVCEDMGAMLSKIIARVRELSCDRMGATLGGGIERSYVI